MAEIIAVICLFIFRRKSKINYEAKHAMFVYFLYFVMKSKKIKVTIRLFIAFPLIFWPSQYH